MSRTARWANRVALILILGTIVLGAITAFGGCTANQANSPNSPNRPNPPDPTPPQPEPTPPGPKPPPQPPAPGSLTWAQFQSADLATWTDAKVIAVFGEPFKRSHVDGKSVFVYRGTDETGHGIFVEFRFATATGGKLTRKTKD